MGDEWTASIWIRQAAFQRRLALKHSLHWYFRREVPQENPLNMCDGNVPKRHQSPGHSLKVSRAGRDPGLADIVYEGRGANA